MKGLEITTIRNEAKRGCGYRKEGGLYMMSGHASGSCGKLPFQLKVCPCCGQGIKPARGFTWIDAQQLFSGVECNHGGCMTCPLADGHLEDHPRMGLVWIGSRHYPTVQDFLAEARAQGVSRRIPAIPKEFEIGETWVLFAHREGMRVTCPDCNGNGGPDPLEGETCETCKGNGRVDAPAIVGCFKPDRIEYVVAKKDTKRKLKRLINRGVKLVKLERDEDREEKNDELFNCERCGKPTGGDYYSAPNCNETGVDVCLCQECAEQFYPPEDDEAEAELARDRVLEEQEREDFAQDGYFENMEGSEIL